MRDGQSKFMRLRAAEFLRRLTLHILPKRFQRIRHYGLLANRVREQALKKCRELLDAQGIRVELTDACESQQELLAACPKCDSTRLTIAKIVAVEHPDMLLAPRKLDTS